MPKRNIAFIVQRYGVEVNGGAEHYCKQLAEKLAALHQVTILTTCAIDYITWNPEYLPGKTEVDGIPVIRFTNGVRARGRYLDLIRQKIMRRMWYQKWAHRAHLLKWAEKNFKVFSVTEVDEMKWLEWQGPACPELISYLQNNERYYDALFFITSLYYPTAVGVKVAPRKSILVPTLHDEDTSYFPLYNKVMQQPEWILYSAPSEKKLGERIYNIAHKKNAITGIGVNPVEVELTDHRVFEKYGIRCPYIIYIGRVDSAKGCDELFDFFQKYKDAYTDPLQLVVVGRAHMELPNRPDIIYTGFTDDVAKWQLLYKSLLLVMPSRHESLSMVLLESFYAYKPVIANAQCEVLKDHIDISKGGFAYENYEEFSKALHKLVNDDGLLQQMGKAGNQYVHNYYNWDTIIKTLNNIIEDVVQVNNQEKIQ
jgi:glycosyltransferase involved in cell wall biosynthesis